MVYTLRRTGKSRKSLASAVNRNTTSLLSGP